jgi:hypothetical protein
MSPSQTLRLDPWQQQNSERELTRSPSTCELPKPEFWEDTAVAVLPLVVIVRFELAGLPLGVTVAGEKAAVAPAGSPKAESVIALENTALIGVSIMAYCALTPRATVCEPVEEATEKSVVTRGATPTPVSWTPCGESAALSQQREWLCSLRLLPV